MIRKCKLQFNNSNNNNNKTKNERERERKNNNISDGTFNINFRAPYLSLDHRFLIFKRKYYLHILICQSHKFFDIRRPKYTHHNPNIFWRNIWKLMTRGSPRGSSNEKGRVKKVEKWKKSYWRRIRDWWDWIKRFEVLCASVH